ncbi:hypothetical protein [Paraburkholderia sp. 40]|uniref:hypothetical protein n=1 Tax=Paraburkholderia sp. 40 TaxID=2991059 RepID=UPI003D22C9DB
MTRFSASASMAMKANIAMLAYNGFFVRKTKMPLSCLTERHCGSMPLFCLAVISGKICLKMRWPEQSLISVKEVLSQIKIIDRAPV